MTDYSQPKQLKKHSTLGNGLVKLYVTLSKRDDACTGPNGAGER